MAAVAAAEAPVAGGVVTLQARLFHSGSGQFSADLLQPGAPDLVNVVAAKDPSSAALVTVVVTLPKDLAVPSETQVHLLARERGTRGANRVLADRRLPLGALARGGSTHLGFWLQGTGCRPVELQATLKLPAAVAPVVSRATLPFACGE